MITKSDFVSAAAAALVLTTCAGNALASAEEPAPAKAALVSLEKSAYEAWKSKDAKFWHAILSDKFTGYGSAGRLDKASAIKEYAGADCDIKSYTLSDEQARPLGPAAALITHKVIIDGSCGGKKVPAVSWAASVYVRESAQWKAAFHAEAAVVDPRAPPESTSMSPSAPAKPVEKMPASELRAARASSEALLALEKEVWEAWRVHDGNKLTELTASDISFINIFGTYFATKADALKDWSAAGCDVQSVSITGPKATMLSPTIGILTFDATAAGTCFGQKVGPVWGTSVYVKDGAAWKWTFGINLPAT